MHDLIGAKLCTQTCALMYVTKQASRQKRSHVNPNFEVVENSLDILSHLRKPTFLYRVMNFLHKRLHPQGRHDQRDCFATGDGPKVTASQLVSCKKWSAAHWRQGPTPCGCGRVQSAHCQVIHGVTAWGQRTQREGTTWNGRGGPNLTVSGARLV